VNSPSSPDPPNQATAPATQSVSLLTEPILRAALSTIPKDAVWRIKGFVRLLSTPDSAPDIAETFILNWAFGRFELTRLDDQTSDDGKASVLLTMMGERGEISRHAKRLAQALSAVVGSG
jgi:hypothetical protein